MGDSHVECLVLTTVSANTTFAIFKVGMQWGEKVLKALCGSGSDATREEYVAEERDDRILRGGDHVGQKTLIVNYVEGNGNPF